MSVLLPRQPRLVNRRAGVAATLAAGFIVWSGPLLEAAPAPQAAPRPVAPPSQTISAAAAEQINALLAEKQARPHLSKVITLAANTGNAGQTWSRCAGLTSRMLTMRPQSLAPSRR